MAGSSSSCISVGTGSSSSLPPFASGTQSDSTWNAGVQNSFRCLAAENLFLDTFLLSLGEKNHHHGGFHGQRIADNRFQENV